MVETNSLAEIHLTVFFAEQVRKFCYEMVVRLALAPLNLKPLSLIGPVPHALWLWRYPTGSPSLTAQRHADFVCPS